MRPRMYIMPTGSFRRNYLYPGGYRLYSQGDKMRIALALLAMVLFTNTVEAQLLRRVINRNQGCPNGVCPTNQPVRQTVRNVFAPVSNISRGHWSYPGTISGHLQSTHGVSTVGMSREQMLNLHDALHEGRTTTTQTRVQIKVPPTPTPTQTRTTIKVSSETTFGLTSSTLTVPDHILAQVAPDSSFGLETSSTPEHVLAQVETLPGPTQVRDVFKSSLIKAAVEARKAGKITARDAVKLRVAMLSPAFVERAHELAVTQMAFSGEVSDAVPMSDEGIIQVEGINWEGLAKFLEAFIPLLITLLKAFGL